MRRVPLACLLAAMVLSAPVAAWFLRPAIYFSASFDAAGSPGSTTVPAEVGQFATPAPAGVFTVVPSADEGGELKISDQGTAVDEVLRGSLKKQYVGQELRLQYEVRASQSTTGLHVRLLDDSDSGMIDCGFGGDGWIRIGGMVVAPYEAGSSYAVTLDLLDPLAGPEYWVATVKKSDGTVWLSSGPLSLDKQLTVRSVEIRRPAGSSAGEFRIDDLRVLSYGLAFGL